MHDAVLGFVSLAVAAGITTGVFGMLVAHEMAHSKSRGERRLAAVMLSGMLYRHFRIAHVHVHHRWAATEHDSATARLGEGFYAFLARTVPGQFLEAWRFERRRCGEKPAYANRAISDIAVSLVTLTANLRTMGLAWGGILCRAIGHRHHRARAIQLHRPLRSHAAHATPCEGSSHSTTAIAGTAATSWSIFLSSTWAGTAITTANLRRPYESLEYIHSAPELPAGYAGSILLALVPPLWHRVMDEKALALRQAIDVPLAA